MLHPVPRSRLALIPIAHSPSLQKGSISPFGNSFEKREALFGPLAPPGLPHPPSTEGRMEGRHFCMQNGPAVAGTNLKYFASFMVRG